MQGDKALMGGETHKGGPNYDRLYHKLKVVIVKSCNYMMQFISLSATILLKLVDLYLIAFKFVQ